MSNLVTIVLPVYTKTADGHDAVVYYDRASESFPYLGMIFNGNEWLPVRWTQFGRLFENREHDGDISFIGTIPSVDQTKLGGV